MGDRAAVQLGVGAGAQLVLLALLTWAVGLGPTGWVLGLLHLAAWTVALEWAARRWGRLRLGPADGVTLARAVLTGGVTALVADGGHDWPVVVLAAAALSLDLVDGWVARGTRTESSFGARFDMETDAFLVLVLSVHVAFTVGPWVMAIGAMRYLFLAAGYPAPWLRAPLPHSLARKAVAAAQGITLVAASAPVVPPWAATVLAAVSLTALTWSFGRDVAGLWRRRRRQGNGTQVPG